MLESQVWHSDAVEKIGKPSLKFIVLNNSGPSKTVEIGRWSKVVLSAVLIGIPVGFAGLSYELGIRKGVAKAETAEETQATEDAKERAEALADMAVEAERRGDLARAWELAQSAADRQPSRRTTRYLEDLAGRLHVGCAPCPP